MTKLTAKALNNAMRKAGEESMRLDKALGLPHLEVHDGYIVRIEPNASIAGGVTVGEGTHIGIGASVIPGIKIGKWCTIGAGAVIIKDVPDRVTVVGIPGREIET